MKAHRPLILFVFLALFLASCGNGDQVRQETKVKTETSVQTGETATVTSDITPTPHPQEEVTASPTSAPSESPPAVQTSPTITTSEDDSAGAPTNTLEPPSLTPTAQLETPTESTNSAQCQEKVAFFGDVTIPDGTFFHQGESFTKTWRFRNEGSCSWTTEYAMVYHSGEIMNAPLSVPLPVSVPPGSIVELSVDMEAPTRGGAHQSNWEFEDPDGMRFGTGSAGKDLFWVMINVRFLDQDDQPQGDPRQEPPPPAPPNCNPQRDTSFENQVLTLINQARTNNGLGSLAVNTKLSAAALAHSTDMACNNFVDHSGSNGSSWYDRIASQGYIYTSATENIYVGNPQFGGNPQGAFEWWMNSQIHRDNILASKMTEIGIGYIFSADSEYGGYYTVNFARE